MKRFAGLCVGLLLGLGVAATPAHAGLFLYPGSDDRISYNNYENLYDSAGHLKSAAELPVVGDFLVGIFDVTNVVDVTGGVASNTPGPTYWTGVYAQEITGISGPSITLANPTRFTFDNVGGPGTFTLPLAPGEMLALYEDPTNDFSKIGPTATNVADASDSALLLTAGIDPLNPFNNAGSLIIVPPPIATGVSVASLSIQQNNTGLTFAPLTSSTLFGPQTGQLIIESHFNPTTPSLVTAGSLWTYESFDPVRLHPNAIPEVSSIWMLGMGLGSLGLFSRKKKFFLI